SSRSCPGTHGEAGAIHRTIVPDARANGRFCVNMPPMEIAERCAVTIAYILKDETGKVLDSSEGREPITYLQGTGAIVSGLEKALLGKKAGDEVKVSLTAADAYGDRDD